MARHNLKTDQRKDKARGIIPSATSSGVALDKIKDEEGRSKASGEATRSQLDNTFPLETTTRWTHPQQCVKPPMTRKSRNTEKPVDALNAENKDTSPAIVPRKKGSKPPSAIASSRSKKKAMQDMDLQTSMDLRTTDATPNSWRAGP
jgi:hypothetical protein